MWPFTCWKKTHVTDANICQNEALNVMVTAEPLQPSAPPCSWTLHTSVPALLILPSIEVLKPSDCPRSLKRQSETRQPALGPSFYWCQTMPASISMTKVAEAKPPFIKAWKQSLHLPAERGIWSIHRPTVEVERVRTGMFFLILRHVQPCLSFVQRRESSRWRPNQCLLPSGLHFPPCFPAPNRLLEAASAWSSET